MKIPLKLWASFAFIFSPFVGTCQYSTGTAVVEIDTGKSAVVAADSMVLHYGRTDNDACKIRLAKPASIVAIGGIGSKGELDFATVGARMLARAEVKDKQDLKKVTSQWTNHLIEFLTGEVKTNEKFMLEFAEKKASSEAIFLTIDKSGQVITDTVGVQITKDDSGKVVVFPSKIGDPPRSNGENGTMFFEFASAEYWKLRTSATAGDQAAYKFLTSMYYSKSAAEIEDDAKKFIDGAESNFEDQVGGPVDEIRLDANGPQWIKVKTACDVDVMTGNQSDWPAASTTTDGLSKSRHHAP